MIHHFGPFRYDTEQRLLFRDDEMVPLVPKAIDTLHVLLERRGRVVEKAELMKLVWPDTVVEDVGLARNISLLRKALGDEGAECPYVETIPRRGYRFVAAETSPPAPAPRQRWLPFAWVAAMAALAGLIYWQFYVPSRFLKRGPGIAALAVVPFESLTPDLSPSGFAQGFTDSLVASLSKLDAVQVVSPSTVRRHQWVGISMGLMGRLLGLEVLVEGTVRKVGDRLRITARLVDVHTGKVIWSDTYDRPAADPGQVESEVAGEVAAQVGAHLAIQGKFPAPR
ncbi:MAG: winged helix-turn-helix domain-containing protein [Bryobacteraceae bacterium]